MGSPTGEHQGASRSLLSSGRPKGGAHTTAPSLPPRQQHLCPAASSGLSRRPDVPRFSITFLFFAPWTCLCFARPEFQFLLLPNKLSAGRISGYLIQADATWCPEVGSEGAPASAPRALPAHLAGLPWVRALALAERSSFGGMVSFLLRVQRPHPCAECVSDLRGGSALEFG